MTEPGMEHWELVARESIRDIVARYNASGDSGRFEETLALFTEDAEMTVLPDEHYRGRDRIRSLFVGAAETTRAASATPGEGDGPARFVRHFTSTHQIDIASPREATGRCYYAVLTDRGLDHWGRYVDRYAREGERWLFRSRTVSIDGAVPGGWAEQVARRGTTR